MKVTFDGVNKKIVINDSITELDVRVDLYSDWKEWLKESDNSKYLVAMRTVGGDPTTGIKSVAPYFFLMNGWKIRPYEGDHTLNIIGNLFVDTPETYGYNIIVPTIGDYTVMVNLSTTSDAIVVETGISGLTEQESQQLASIENVGTDIDSLINFMKNKKLLKKEGSTWYLVIRNNDDSADILKKALKDKNGDNISDVKAGLVAQELKSSV